jgi:hypothetical protein
MKISFVLFGGSTNSLVDGIGVCCSCFFCDDHRRVLDALRPYLQCREASYRFDAVVLVGLGFCCGCLGLSPPLWVVVVRVFG